MLALFRNIYSPVLNGLKKTSQTLKWKVVQGWPYNTFIAESTNGRVYSVYQHKDNRLSLIVAVKYKSVGVVKLEYQLDLDPIVVMIKKFEAGYLPQYKYNFATDGLNETVQSEFAHDVEFKQSANLVIDNISHTEIKLSELHGLGLFAERKLSAGTKLATLDGQVVEYDFYYLVKDKLNIDPTADNYVFMEWNSLPNKKLLARMFRTKYSYINHSRTPNCKLLGNPPELWTYQDIEIGEELTLDYRDEPLPDNYLTGHGSTYL